MFLIIAITVILGVIVGFYMGKGSPKNETALDSDTIYEVLSVSERQKNEKGDYYLIVVKNSASGEEWLYKMKEIPPKIFHNVGDKNYPCPDPTK